jgi:simple sugar transport system ATP-binding protein
MADELVRMERINKYFGRVQALNDVTLTVRKNEIVGLLGDNGAGKSTLIKILSGALRPDSGEIYIHGAKVKMRNTTDAIARGIETIYQDSALVVQLSIARNLFLGREPVIGPRLFDRLDQKAMNEAARQLLSRSASRKKSRRPPRSALYRPASVTRLRLPGRCISKVN